MRSAARASQGIGISVDRSSFGRALVCPEQLQRGPRGLAEAAIMPDTYSEKGRQVFAQS